MTTQDEKKKEDFGKEIYYKFKDCFLKEIENRTHKAYEEQTKKILGFGEGRYDY